jgi:hypothetical protein
MQKVRFPMGRGQKAKADWEGGSLKKNVGKTLKDFGNPFAEAVRVSLPSNSGRRWTPQDIYELKLLARTNTPVDLIACELQRTKESVRAIAKREGIAFRWTGKESSTPGKGLLHEGKISRAGVQ